VYDSIGIARRAPRPLLLGGAIALVAVLASLLVVVLAAPPARGATADSGPVTLQSGVLTVTLNARTYQLLTSRTRGAVIRTRTLDPIKPANTSLPEAFAFPLTRGRVDPTLLSGSARSRGGIDFSSLARNQKLGQSSLVQFRLTSFALDLSSTPAELTATFVGQQTYHDLPIATLGTSQAQTATHGRTVTMSGFVVKLLAAGAQLFNQQAFANQKHRFHVGEAVGSLMLTGFR
jgi:hypothetical protein